MPAFERSGGGRFSNLTAVDTVTPACGRCHVWNEVAEVDEVVVYVYAEVFAPVRDGFEDDRVAIREPEMSTVAGLFGRASLRLEVARAVWFWTVGRNGGFSAVGQAVVGGMTYLRYFSFRCWRRCGGERRGYGYIGDGRAARLISSISSSLSCASIYATTLCGSSCDGVIRPVVIF